MQHDFGEIETDVLVVGGGLAALSAAWSARRAGARVLVAVKRRLGKSGSSANTSGGYAASLAELDPLDNSQIHYEDTISGGGWVNERKLVRALVEEGPIRLRELFDLGAPFRMRGGNLYRSPSGDHRRARVLVPFNMIGTDMTEPMRNAAIDSGVDVLENCVIVDLLRDDDHIVGAIGIARDRMQGFVIRAGATIVAAGGAGRMFPVTSNPIDVRGAAYALPLRSGARLRDMEFIQFYPWRLIRPFKSARVPIQPSTFVLGGRLYNSLGERFMETVDTVRQEATTRDISARAIFNQIRRGHDVEGGVVLDISTVPDEEFRIQNPKVVNPLDARGVDYRAIQLIVAPEAHFVMGGVFIDEHGRSDLSGLYAVGESAGGVHGGNRLNSNAIPDCLVFGHRAGIDAASRGSIRRGLGNQDGIAKWQGRLSAVSAATEVSPALKDLSTHQQTRMSIGLGIVRSGEGLHRALADIDDIRSRLADHTPASLGDLLMAAEIDDLCDVGAACAHSALARTESRAAHFREDFPETDPNWLRTVTYSNGGISFQPLLSDPEEANWTGLAGDALNPMARQSGEREFVE